MPSHNCSTALNHIVSNANMRLIRNLVCNVVTHVERQADLLIRSTMVAESMQVSNVSTFGECKAVAPNTLTTLRTKSKAWYMLAGFEVMNTLHILRRDRHHTCALAHLPQGKAHCCRRSVPCPQVQCIGAKGLTQSHWRTDTSLFPHAWQKQKRTHAKLLRYGRPPIPQFLAAVQH